MVGGWWVGGGAEAGAGTGTGTGAACEEAVVTTAATAGVDTEVGG